MAGKRRRFSQEFKREAVRLAYLEGRSVSQVAEELDLRDRHAAAMAGRARR